MLENMTTGEKALIGATAIGIAALVFHKPTRNAVGLSDGRKAAPFIRKIAELATNNYHTEARLELAKKYGNPRIVREYKKIIEIQEKKGHLPNRNYEQRARLDNIVLERAEEEMRPQEFNDLIEAFNQ